ncbi:MAG TPA: SHOCT domain-containing protein [Candidatus Acidoferrum sp.]|nr:SHOCT domain-containing protein [Candidatus Acidoferrum sp.]
MKRLLVSLLVGLSAMTLLTGCSWSINGGRKISNSSSEQTPTIGQQVTAPTLGQQLIDLQKAKDSGAITDAEYQAQKAKLLENK